MPIPLACPVDHSPLTPTPQGLRSAAGRVYPPRAGGWDLRPPSGDASAPVQAEIYDAMTGEMTDFRAPHNLTLVAQREWLDRLPLAAGDRVLELGGHRSGVLPWLEEREVTCAGVDISAAWVDAQNRAAAERGSDTKWVVGDATALPFPDRTFAAVVAFDVLEHVEDLERAVNELFRVLRPGGHLLVHMPVQDIRGSLDGLSRWRDAADFAARQATVGHYHERMPSRQRMRILLEHVGFQVVDLQPFNIWIQPLHDYRVLPALARVRHRSGKTAAPKAPSNAPPSGGAARRPGPSAWQRAYAATAIPVWRALSSVDRLGALLDVGGSAFFLAQRPAGGVDPLRQPRS